MLISSTLTGKLHIMLEGTIFFRYICGGYTIIPQDYSAELSQLYCIWVKFWGYLWLYWTFPDHSCLFCVRTSLVLVFPEENIFVVGFHHEWTPFQETIICHIKNISGLIQVEDAVDLIGVYTFTPQSPQVFLIGWCVFTLHYNGMSPLCRMNWYI